MLGETEFMGWSHLNAPHTKAPYKSPRSKGKTLFISHPLCWDQRKSAKGPSSQSADKLDEGLEKSKMPLWTLKFKDDPRAKDENKTGNIPETPRPSFVILFYQTQNRLQCRFQGQCPQAIVLQKAWEPHTNPSPNLQQQFSQGIGVLGVGGALGYRTCLGYMRPWALSPVWQKTADQKVTLFFSPQGRRPRKICSAVWMVLNPNALKSSDHLCQEQRQTYRVWGTALCQALLYPHFNWILTST